jgi:transducin (beta)-like 1
MSITSDEVNYLIYRYLKESGFEHAAFTFAYESNVAKYDISANDVPPGALVYYLQKGLQFVEVETHVREDGTELDCAESFSLIRHHKCKPKGTVPLASANTTINASSINASVPFEPRSTTPNPGSNTVKREENSNSDFSEPMDEVETGIDINPERVSVLEGHTSEVFMCSFNPVTSLLASGSGDETARIWRVPEGLSGRRAASEASRSSVVLRHSSPSSSVKDVTTLDWSPDGNTLATGSYDGLARIWDSKGQLKATLVKHTAPIFSLKWNRTGDMLLSGSVDHSAIVWDAKTFTIRAAFEMHTAPCLDVDWRDSTSFATCSTDGMVHICQVGRPKPIASIKAHNDEVNAIQWDPQGLLLASCSDDTTTKIWKADVAQPIHVLKEHKKEIYTIRWSPTGPGSANPNKPLLLASAAFDYQVKLWDAETGKMVHNLNKHTEPVYSVTFHPSGDYLASGSFDRCLHIWSTKDGSLVKTYKGNGGIFETCWNARGDKVAACYSNNTVCVMDFRM